MAAPPPSTSQPGHRATWGLAAITLGLILFSVRAVGLVGEAPDPISNTRIWTFEEAATYDGPLTGPIRLDGVLAPRGGEPVWMPDTGDGALRGWLTLAIRSSKEPGGPGVRRSILTWEAAVDGVDLVGEGIRIPLDVDFLYLPLYHDPDVRAWLHPSAEAPTEIHYDAGLDEPLIVPLEDMDLPGPHNEVEVERAWLPTRLGVSVLAGLDGTGEQARLVGMEEWAVEVKERNEQQVPTQRRGLGALAMGLGLLLTFLGGWTLRDTFR